MPEQSTMSILAQIAAEMRRQDAKWGEQDHPDGTGPQYAERAEYERIRTDNAAKDGALTWRHILAEEVAEAFAETDPAQLRGELEQVSAVAAQWMKAIDRRTQTDPPANRCPDCGATGYYDARLQVHERGVYRCPDGHIWQDDPDRAAELPDMFNMRSRAEAAEAERDRLLVELGAARNILAIVAKERDALAEDLARNLVELYAAVSGSSRRTQGSTESFDRAALIDRWVENFGLNLRSGVEAALAEQEADHVAGLIAAAIEATRRAQEQWAVIRAAIAWRRTIADSGEYALDDADALVEAVDALLYDDGELPGMWERADYTGGLDEVREPERPVDLWFGARPKMATSPVRHAEDGRTAPSEPTGPVSGVIAVSNRFARAAADQDSDVDWVRLRTGSGRQYEGYRSDTCPGDGVPSHLHDIRCIRLHASPNCACGVNDAGQRYVDPICQRLAP